MRVALVLVAEEVSRAARRSCLGFDDSGEIESVDVCESLPVSVAEHEA